MRHHLAQVNIGRIRGPMDGEVMREFREALDEINALAESSPGFVWRLQTEDGNATSIQAFPDPMLLVNLSVWESVESLQAYVYRSAHGKFFARRAQWFEKLNSPRAALWWIPAGTRPTVQQAQERLETLAKHGETVDAFTFKRSFPPYGGTQ